MKTLKFFVITVFFLLFIKVLFGYSKTILDQPSNRNGYVEKATSVSMINGKYKIDTAFIRSDKNKFTLLSALELDSLTTEKCSNEIPRFIMSFLDSISASKKFDLASPDEEWQMGPIGPIGCSGIPPFIYFPTKQLVYFGISKNNAVLSYYTGGLSQTGGHRKYQHSMIIKFNNTKIIDFWFGNNSEFFNSKKEIINNLKHTQNGGC